MTEVEAAGLENRHFEKWTDLRERNVSIIRTNLLIYAAVVPVVTILSKQGLLDLSTVFTPNIIVVGLGLSVASSASAGFNLLQIQSQTRDSIESNVTDNQSYKTATDYLAVTEVLTAVSGPVTFLGIVRLVVDISLYWIVGFGIVCLFTGVALRLFTISSVSLFYFASKKINSLIQTEQKIQKMLFAIIRGSLLSLFILLSIETNYIQVEGVDIIEFAPMIIISILVTDLIIER
jgi:hypothetical protein